MKCSKCKSKNLSYYNYCKSDGECLGKINKKLMFKKDSENICSKCDNEIISSDNYCSICGNMLAKSISRKESIKDDINQEQISNTFNKFDFKGLYLKEIVFSVVLTLLLTSGILLLLFTNKFYSDVIYKMSYYQDLLPSKFDLFMYNLSLINSASISMFIKMALVNVGSAHLSIRTIIYPIIIMGFMYLSTSVFLNNKVSRNSVIETSITTAFIYSLIILIIGAMSSFSIDGEDAISLLVKVDIVGLFIKSFIVSFIGAYLGITRDMNLGLIASLFKDSIKSILGGFSIVTLVLGIIVYYELSKNNDIYTYISHYTSDVKPLINLCLVVGTCVIGSWMFTLCNFASISLFGVVGYNIISLSSETNKPFVLIILIPIILLILIGRKLSNNYGDNLKVIGIFSGMYSVIMLVFSYFTKFVISINSDNLQTYINEFIYNDLSSYSYEYGDVIQGYLAKIYNNIENGIYIGPNLFTVLIGSFVFSFVFVYIGYKTNKNRVA